MNKTQKGIQKKYNESKKGKTRLEKYHKSKKGKEALKRSKDKYFARLKEKAFKVLGGKCSNPNCLVPGGCIDVRCLQIDHIRGDGVEDRAKGNKGLTLFLKIIKNPIKVKEEYQILCANCNWIKRVENLEYLPNKKTNSKETYKQKKLITNTVNKPHQHSTNTQPTLPVSP